MKRFKLFNWLLIIFLLTISVPLTLIEEFFKWIFSLPGKIKLNYQFMMFLYQFTR